MSGGSKLDAFQARIAALGRRIEAGFGERARELREAAERLDAGDAAARAEVQRLSHKLRGIAANAGHRELTDRAARLEDAAKSEAADLAIGEGARRLAAALEKAGSGDAPAVAASPAAATSGLELGWRVIALDDEPSTRRLLSITLSQAGGCDAHVLGDPEEAMALAQERAPDLVIVDAMMPDVDGLAFYRDFRRRVSSRVPVVILSAASPEELGWALPDDPRLRWMRKPFRPGALLADLRAFVER